MGSVISLHHLERIDNMVKRAKDAGSKILAGGERLSGRSEIGDFSFSKGAFYPPTVIADVAIEDEIWKEEVFGPVVVVKRFSVSVLDSYFEKLLWLNNVLRMKLKVLHWRIQASTDSALGFGLWIYPEPIGWLLRYKPVSVGSIRTIAMTQALLGV
jgi:delta 1-pyrroline-5-carboxylate dehydrogenase